MKKILVAGPTYIDYTINLKDQLSLDGSSNIKSELEHLGGTGACYAKALSRLGMNIYFHSIIGNDERGKDVRNLLQKEDNIQLHLQETANSTDYAYILVDNGNHKVAASKRESSIKWTVDEKFIDHLEKCDALVITSFDNKIVKEILKQVKNNGLFVLWAPHKKNCQNARILTKYLHLVSHITLSKEEYDILISQIGDPLNLGVKSITITKNAEGSLLRTGGVNKNYLPFQIIQNPKDSNGAGEAFGSGFLAGMLETSNFDKSIGFASYVASLHVQRNGSDFPRRNVRSFLLKYLSNKTKQKQPKIQEYNYE